ncbi:MAG: sulfite exporter TauE/SafE family protein [Treponema sp.]
MLYAVLGVLGLLTLIFSFAFIRDVLANKDQFEKETNFWISGAIGFVINFFDTLGIGSFAPATALLRGFKQIKDRVIPGTLNVSCTWPVVAEAFIFMTIIKVEPITLISMLISATIGAWVGAALVSRFDEKKVQVVMGLALIVTAFFIVAGNMGWMPIGGEEIGLTGVKLIIAVVVNFVLGAMMSFGVGLYAPCMALVFLMGMSPKVAFPIMMGSCAYLMPVGSIKFIKEGAYAKKASIAIALFGVAGVFVAAFLVKSLPLNILKWLVVGVVFYTAVTLLMAGLKKKAPEAEKAE